MGEVQGRLSLRTHNGSLQQSVDGGTTWSAAAGGGGWIGERASVAISRVPTLNRYHGTDYLDGEFFLGGGAFAPTQATNESNGVLIVPGGLGTGYVSLGKIDSQVLIGAPKTESWYLAARQKVTVAAFPGGDNAIPLGLYQNGHSLYLVWSGSVSTTVLQLNMNNGSDHFTSLGTAGTIGSGIPLNAYFLLAMHFNAVSGILTVEINDVPVATFSGSGLTNMSTQQGSVIVQNNDGNAPMRCDSLFGAWNAPL